MVAVKRRDPTRLFDLAAVSGALLRWFLAPLVFRDHSAFLNSCTPEDGWLYDDAQSR